MKVITNKTKLQKVGAIEIPDLFFQRVKTGNTNVDKIFGEGALPGMSFTVFGKAGSCKSTFLLQLAELVNKNGYKAAYISGEESIHQVAYTCKRLGVKNIDVANTTSLEDILEAQKQYDLVIIDSFPTIETDEVFHSSEQMKKHIVDSIVMGAKANRCVTGIVLHATKQGTYKGSTHIIHSVDANFSVSISEDDENVRVITSEKNRFGSIGTHAFYLTSSGYDFGQSVQIATETKGSKKRSNPDEEAVAKIDFSKGKTCEQVAKECNIDYNRAYYFLRKMQLNGKLNQTGRGQKAIYRAK